MANCHNLFQIYNTRIKLSDSRRGTLLAKREELRNRMRKRFNKLYEEFRQEEQLNVDHELEFYSQGSFVMDTIITPKDDDYDLDDGVYFSGNLNQNDRPNTSVFHNWVIRAIGEEEQFGKVSDKDTCVRVRYKEGIYGDESKSFHIDLPIYYAEDIYDPELAHKKKSWIISNPIEFIDWFESKIESGFQKSFLFESTQYDQYEKWLKDIRKKDSQLRRIVRYLKGWSDHIREEMPPGIVMTILAGENYKSDERDDVSLRKTLEAIIDWLDSNEFKCPRPTTPKKEDLFAYYNEVKKEYFKNALDEFAKSARQALSNSNQKEACLKWKKHLGGRFPCDLARDENLDAKTFATGETIRSNARSA